MLFWNPIGQLQNLKHCFMSLHLVLNLLPHKKNLRMIQDCYSYTEFLELELWVVSTV